MRGRLGWPAPGSAVWRKLLWWGLDRAVAYDAPKSGTVIEPSELRGKPELQAICQGWPSGFLKWPT
jgi:hypothetical protein